MVTGVTEQQEDPAYKLEDIQMIAANGNRLSYGSTKVGEDAEELECSMEEILRCIATLSPNDFRHSQRYELLAKGRGAKRKFALWQDVYHVRFRTPIGAMDLYVKLSIFTDCVVLHSFHPKGQHR